MVPITVSLPQKLEDLAPSWTSRVLSFTPTSGWPAFNPSIWWNGNDITVCIRSANYRLGHRSLPSEMLPSPGDLSPPHETDFRTLNYIGSLSEGLEWRQTPTPVVLPDGVGDPAWRDRIEDCRLLMIDGALGAVASIYDRPQNKAFMCFMRIGGDGKILGILPLVSPMDWAWEKNWMPVVRGRTLHLIYSCRPSIVISLDFTKNTMSTWQAGSGPEDLQGWSGSSQGCDIDGSALCVVHRKERVDDRLRYSHRFVMFDRDLRICAMSKPFIFQQDGVEFCAGMTRVRDRLFLSYGVADTVAMIGTMSVDEALASLTPHTPA
ncbi:hypothetical protein [Azospirillum sp. TSO35-2]|uniref:hypothetical protein n=1 Tax=Azospirillum sp. TSO35-2 TaxID=716796 RepID=UPI000D60ACB4|nr:hypothetical protein [Azospirillum sp. TSO35-2]PWC36259.1 hypothetical protein TSO352_14150 [Azospirillum sp. TSO35-2]